MFKRQKAVTLLGNCQEAEVRLITGGQSKVKGWKIVPDAEEQSGSEQWESGAYIDEIEGAGSVA